MMNNRLMSEDKDLKKLNMLMNAFNEVKAEENQEEELDEAPDFYADLKEAAWTTTTECWRYRTRSGNGQSISPPNVPWNYTTYLLRRNANKAF